MIPRLKKFNRFSGLVNAKTKGNCQSSRKKNMRRRPPSGLTCYEEARYEIEWAQGALNSLAIAGNAFEYSIPCLQILYSSCQFDISRKSDSSFLSQRGFTR